MKFYAKVLLAAALGGAIHSQAVFQGQPGGAGNVMSLGNPHGAPILHDVIFLPLEVSGRTVLASLDPERAQLREDIPGANRVLLPNNGGSLYRYRTNRGQGQVFGFLLVEASGAARSIAEFSGFGPQGTQDPMEGFIAVEGNALWFTTVEEVGGDVIEIDLSTGAKVNRTTNMDPLRFLPRGLALFPSFGIVMSESGPLRVLRSETLARQLEFEGLKPEWFGADIVSSKDGSTFAFIAGPSLQETHVYYGREGGLLKRVSSVPTGLSSAGFAYDTPNGPWLGLSDDGSLAAWISQGDSRELFLRSLSDPMPAPEFQVTADQRFADTLNESGVISFVSAESLVVLIGDDSGSGQPEIESGDFFRIDVLSDFPAPDGQVATSIQNLSLTSGDAFAPFLTGGTLATSGGVFQVPGFEGLLTFDEGRGAVVAMDWNGSITELIPNVDDIHRIYRAGTEYVIDVFLVGAQGEEDRSALYRLNPTNGAVSLLAELNPGVAFSRAATSEDGSFSAIAQQGARQWLGAIHVPTETTQAIVPIPLHYGPTQGFQDDGSLLFTVEFAGLTYFAEWDSLGKGISVRGVFLDGFVLPSR